MHHDLLGAALVYNMIYCIVNAVAKLLHGGGGAKKYVIRHG
jgi:hypothetical protein